MSSLLKIQKTLEKRALTGKNISLESRKSMLRSIKIAQATGAIDSDGKAIYTKQVNMLEVVEGTIGKLSTHFTDSGTPIEPAVAEKV